MRLYAALCVGLCAFTLPACFAEDELLFEDFVSVEKWQGFELSQDQAHSGNTSALWHSMDQTPSVSSDVIPHDWTAYAAFTFWVYNEKVVPTRLVCVISSENPATEGPDYWSVRVPLNFTGWRRFGALIRPGTGAGSPLGWDQIERLSFTATHSDDTPNPEAAVHIDELKLTNELAGPGPLISDEEFFQLLREDVTGLAATRSAAATGDYEAAKARLLEYMRARVRPVWCGFDVTNLPPHMRGGARPVSIFDWHEWDRHRDPEFDTAAADRICEHIFNWKGREANLGPDIDWQANPFDRDEPAYTPDWTAKLNRFSFWRDLGEAYWATGDEKYAQEFIAQMLHWIHDQPAPVLRKPHVGLCWSSLQQGMRTGGSWMHAYHYFLGSPSMTPQALCAFLKSFVEHARTLTRMTLDYPARTTNWVMHECRGLATIGVMFPEFQEAKRWREVAYGRLRLEIDRQVYPDGAQKELSTGYHNGVRKGLFRVLRLAQLNGVRTPEGCLESLKRMYWYNLCCMIPGGLLPPLNDAGMPYVKSALQEAYETWGDPEFLWAATDGAAGKPVEFTSCFFPWAGQCIMRSGWNSDDRYLMFEIGPFGINHQHEDKLSIFLYGYGRTLLREAGTYTYDHSKWRRYVVSTAAHNTMMVDGLGQHRRGLRETYAAEQPLEDCWATTEVFDWAIGIYHDGYGERRTDIAHERTVIFVRAHEHVRPDYYVVIDRMLGEGEHTYSNLFHLDADEASVDQQTLVVSTQQADRASANLTLVPLARDGLALRMVKGQEDPVQGWVPRQNHRPIPTAIYEKTGVPPQLFVTVLLPHTTVEVPGFSGELVAETDQMVAVKFVTERTEDIVLYAFEGPRAMQAAGVATHARLAVVQRSVDDEVRAGLLGGSEIQVDGEAVPSPVVPAP